MPSLERQVRRAQERRIERASKTPEVAYLIQLVYGLYQADKNENPEQFEELFTELKGYCQKIEAASKKDVDASR